MVHNIHKHNHNNHRLVGGMYIGDLLGWWGLATVYLARHRIGNLVRCDDNGGKIVNTALKFSQRRRDDNKNKICGFEEGGGWVAKRRLSKTLFFFVHGKRLDSKILKVQNSLSRNFVVIAQAPIFARIGGRTALVISRTQLTVPQKGVGKRG